MVKQTHEPPVLKHACLHRFSLHRCHEILIELELLLPLRILKIGNIVAD